MFYLTTLGAEPPRHRRNMRVNRAWFDDMLICTCAPKLRGCMWFISSFNSVKRLGVCRFCQFASIAGRLSSIANGKADYNLPRTIRSYVGYTMPKLLSLVLAGEYPCWNRELYGLESDVQKCDVHNAIMLLYDDFMKKIRHGISLAILLYEMLWPLLNNAYARCYPYLL